VTETARARNVPAAGFFQSRPRARLRWPGPVPDGARQPSWSGWL